MLVLGRSQVVRQRILIPPFPGSNPGAPASKSSLSVLAGAGAEKARTLGAFCAFASLLCARNRLEIRNFCGKSLASTEKIPFLRSGKAETGSIVDCAAGSAVMMLLKFLLEKSLYGCKSAFVAEANIAQMRLNVCF